MIRFSWLIVLVLVMASCRSTKKIGTAIIKKDTTSDSARDKHADSLMFMRETLSNLNTSRINYKTFNSKVNIDYRDASNKHYDLNAVIRMYKDSAIWVSANAVLGIEAMRALVTKDSVKILDKLNKTYTVRSIDYLQEVASLPLNLSVLQDLLIGNAVFVDSNVVSYKVENGMIGILTVGEFFKTLLTISEMDKSIQHSKLDDVDITHNRTAHLYYNDYENKKGPSFPTKRRILVSRSKQLDIQLDFKQYEFDSEVSFPFSVPKNYKRN